MIGGTAANAGNVISGNGNNGVGIAAAGTTGTRVEANFIGTNAAGAPGVGNVISGNTLTGVNIINAGTSGNRVAGNIIGLDSAGTTGLGNSAFGVAVAAGATGNIIGEAGGRNVISGNAQAGVRIVDVATDNNLVQNNFIGLDVTGTLARPNLDEGVILDTGGVATGNIIGGVGLGNVISGNGGSGIRILNGMTATLVVDNIIGRDPANTASIPNGGGGVRIQSSSGNTIGGTGASEGNVIGGNSGDGVAIVGTATGNAILSNSIFSNSGLGIDLADDGVTLNDEDDADSGPNDLLNWTGIYGISESGGTLTVDFSIDLPAGSYRIEFFKNPSGADPSGNGEGEIFASSRTITHAGIIPESFSHSFAGAVGEVVTATTTFCTDGATCAAFGNTSELGNAFTQGVTAVRLTSFTAVAGDGAVDLHWETASELDNLGFHLYRSSSGAGPYERITARAIPGLGSSPVGAKYSYRDTGLTNGVTYYYKLEDIETTGRITFHGPVLATPEAGASSNDEDSSEGSLGEDGDTSPARITYGDPSASSLKVVRRGHGQVVLELETAGFYAEPQEDGSVRLEIPGFEALTDPNAAGIPVRRTSVEAIAGRKVKLVSVQASGVVAFTSLRPSDGEMPEIVVTPDGAVHARRSPTSVRRRARAAFRGEGPYPEAARVLSVGFQGEAKKALLELVPLRWDASKGQLLLARRLVVRISFRREPSETDGVRGRRYPRRRSHDQRTVVACLGTTERGLHSVRYEEMMRGRRGVRAKTLRLSRQGEAVAFHLEPKRNRFKPGSVLYFVSEGAQANPYGREAVYELEVVRDGEAGEAGEAMVSVSAAPSGEPTRFYWHRAEWEENRYYQAALQDAPDLWLWDLLFAPVVKSYPFEVSALALRAPSEASHLSVWLQGVSDLRTVAEIISHSWMDATCSSTSAGKRIF